MNKKIEWLLILQGWAMLWVVIGHAGPANHVEEFPSYALALWNFAYSFHMPLFIMISGFLFYLTRINSSKWTYLPMIKEKLIRFGIPFVVWTLFAMIIKSVFSSEVERATTISIGEFINAILYPYNGPMREFWFLGVIIWMFVLYPIWKLLLINVYIIFFTSLLLVLFYFYSLSTDFLALNHVSKHISHFWWGLLVAKAYLYINNQDEEDRFGRWIIPLFEKIWPSFFSSFRNYTYQIYLLGLFAQEVVKMVRLKLGLPFEPMYVVSIFAGLYIPVLISLIIEKINWKPLKLCIGLK